MNLTQQISRARSLSRTSSASHTDDQVADRINDGMREFVKRSHGHMTDEYLALSPKFQTETHFAIKVTTDAGADTVAITGTARTGATGTQVATDLQTTLQAGTHSGATVAWSTTAWAFTITISGSEYITVEAPAGDTYADATRLLFNKTGREDATTWTGNHPEDCTVETTLPTDYDAIQYVEWDDEELDPAPFDMFLSPGQLGIPKYYGIKGNKIRLSPVPETQGRFHVFYKAKPTFYTDSTTDATLDCPLDADYHMAPVYYAAGELASEAFEYQVEAVNRGKFAEMLMDYIREYANQTPKWARKDEGFEHMRIQMTMS